MTDAPTFPATRADALARWEEFVERAPDYARDRNRVAPGHLGVSRMSPALRVRLVTELGLAARVIERHPNARVEKLVQEIEWRRYFKGWLELRPDVWSDWLRRARDLRKHGDPAMLERATDVAEGRSGVAVMDRFARELIETGYVHNHARMWWAGYWIHVEKLPWELGADWYFRHLLDADPASNTLSWRWVAGLHTVGRTYLPRRANLSKYVAKEWLDLDGIERLAGASATEIEDDADATLHSFERLPAIPTGLPARYGVWIHVDDLALETAEIASLQPSSVRGFLWSGIPRRFRTSVARYEYLRTALDDGARRAGAHWNCDARALETDDVYVAIAKWALEEKLETVVALKPFVGPIADSLPGIRDALARVGVPLVLARRASDTDDLPAARGAYSGFWRKVQWRHLGR